MFRDRQSSLKVSFGWEREYMRAAPVAVRFAFEGPVGGPLVSPKLLPIGHDGPYMMRLVNGTLVVERSTYKLCGIDLGVTLVFLWREKSHVTRSRLSIPNTKVCRDFRAIRCRDSGDRTAAGLHCLTDIPVMPFAH
jgi:hypothetical protein